MARGKIYTAQREGREIPLGWAVDRQGQSTTDPAKALAGLILPIGGHKGYAISFMIDVLAGVLSGSEFATGVAGPYQAERPSGCGHLIIVLDIAAFMQPEEFTARVESMIDEVKATPLAPGFDEILYPGEPEARAERANLRDGVPLDEATFTELSTLGRELGIALSFDVTR